MYFTDTLDKVFADGIRFENRGNASWDNGNLILRGQSTVWNYGRFDLTCPVGSIKFSDATYYYSSTSRWVSRRGYARAAQGLEPATPVP
jgi:hypothetical protein